MTSREPTPEGVVRVRAPNPSPLTLDGTNTYLAAGWAVDPGPDDPGHVDAVLEAADRVAAGGGGAGAGGGAAGVPGAGAGAAHPIEGIALTHGHGDHSGAAERLARRAGGVPVVLPEGGEEAGPFRAVATPGHSPDSVCLLLGRICFTGDTVLGEGSVFIAPGEGSLAAYLDSLRRLRELELDWLCPGHGPFVDRPREKLDAYIEHRLDRERKLLAALEAGARTTDELLDRAWGDVPRALRPAAAVTLAAHLEKLGAEGRLPEGGQAGGAPG